MKNSILKVLILLCMLLQNNMLHAQGNVNLVAGHVTTLTYTYATGVQAVLWDISDYSVVNINSTSTYMVGAVIKGVGEGTATVTAKYYYWNYDYSRLLDGEVTWYVTVTLPDPEVISLQGDSITIHNSKYLQVDIYPELAKRDLVWQSSNSSILTVDENGKITGMDVGTADITVTTHNGISASKSITVHPIYVESIWLSDIETLLCGRPQQLQAVIAPENATYKEIDWTSSDESIVTVENGIVYPKQCGEVEISAIAQDSHHVTEKRKIQINPVVAEKIELSQTESEVTKFDSIQLRATIYPEDVTYSDVLWTSSDERIATVKEGHVVAKRPGSVTITATTMDGQSAICNVKVLDYDYHATFFVDEIALYSQTTPTNEMIPIRVENNFPATNSQFDVYLPDGISLVTVIAGDIMSERHHLIFSEISKNHYRVLCSSEENAIFTARSGILAFLKLQVNSGLTSGNSLICIKRAFMSDIDTPSTLYKLPDYDIPISVSTHAENISIDGVVRYVNVGDVVELIAKIYPENATTKEVVWSSSDEKIAKIEDGIVTTLAEGSVTITATTCDGSSLSANCDITIVNPAELAPVDIIVDGDNNVRIIGKMTEASIYYTIDGKTPTKESLLYTGPFTISHNLTIKAVEVWTGGVVVSPIATLDVSIFEVAKPIILHEGNIITISCETEDATIYYTTDGTEPTAGSSLYTLPVTIDSNCTIKAIAFKDGYNDSQVTTFEVDWIKICGYAVLDTSTGTLTFKYGPIPEGDNVWETENTDFSITSSLKAPWVSTSLKKVVFDASYAEARPTSTSLWFSAAVKLEEITGLEYLNTSEVTNMSLMFMSCSLLTNLDVSHFNTSNVTNMNWMFSSCSSLKSINVTNFDTSNVTDMGRMFNNCSGLTSLDVSNFDTSNVTYMDNMFSNCSGLTSLDVSNFNTSNVILMGSIFSGCSGLKTVFAGDGWTTENVTYSDKMFDGCTNLVGGKGTKYNKLYVNKEYAHIDGGSSNPGYFTASGSEPYVPEPCGYAILDTSTGTLTFKYGPMPEGDNVFETENTGTKGPWDRSVIKTVIFESSYSAARPTTTEGWFSSCTLLTSISGIENLNTSEVTDMHNMFNGCSNLESLDVSHFNTSKVTNMNGMFRECKKLQTLDVSHFDTSNVTNMSYFFYNCNALEALDVSNFNTENVAYMGLVFGGCYKLTELNLTNFNTKNAILMNNMFANCKNLTELDLSSFQTSLVSEMSGMFRKCEKLKTIYVGEGWTTENVIYSNMMFEDCTSLIGGKGFAYDSNYTDMTYARIDGGMSAPGYFTRLLLMGDANDDGVIDMVDVVAMVNYILGTPSESFRTLAADVIPDGEIDVFDVTKLIGMILAKNERPAGLRRAGDSDVARENVLLTAAGNNVYLGVNLPERFTAFQFDVKVPDGCELEDVSRVSHANNHVLKFAKIGENSYSVLGFSMANELFNDVNGRLLELSLSGNAMGEVTISNIQFISLNEERTFFRDETLKVSTGIDVLAVEKDEAIYDLSGQKQNTAHELLKKGFYIINGKKKVIK